MNDGVNGWAGLSVAGNGERFSFAALAALATVACERMYPITAETAAETTSETVASISGATIPAK